MIGALSFIAAWPILIFAALENSPLAIAIGCVLLLAPLAAAMEQEPRLEEDDEPSPIVALVDEYVRSDMEAAEFEARLDEHLRLPAHSSFVAAARQYARK